ncbi:hypothetical protein C343_05329 [Cryptococcus neoformans C23]|uniref:Zn(2)-C6 fungal-type domain-containing protein n=2 Tax=Cryptococcus neoformans TaxID=5207 RepID=A0A854Q7Z1_CRYNE|nr:hypothetical protein CNAG_04473 [Cryptococcus neoformans var. grubii H99]AUB27182.1 hypothetical protein CKF44_04473 [Cryptococcus neoformans var. grubii]OWZ28900.1 hypothetical protein C347_05376 [Cryptococcus neoformans var. grubii AD2-60a]OWZ35202.1 hypothetical protein C353_05226 [Cryptococcus neoformans var. grubii AD1-83a]OWZ40850.1 hypothetical protein C343_05329 [Cryptococcus neoformans var. grubii C23]OXC82655.1 hypothetical protein C344_05053 [Cryptococcus neoformans var. grubii A|eukprot:XP_012051548.1 hypothetical protein CNAG_04473 [Cryptococcus neoformans var. grubii H99]
MSLHLDYAEISRQARRIVDANRAKTIMEQASQSKSSSKRVKYTRSTAGCLACRSRKVKCDETLPACLRCVAAQRECEYPPPGDAGRKRKNGRGRSGDSAHASESGTVGEKRARLSESVGGRDDDGQTTSRGQGHDVQGQAWMEIGGEAIVRGVGNEEWGVERTIIQGAQTDPSPLNGTPLSPSDFLGDGTSRMGISPGDPLNFSTTDFSFLNEFIPFVSPPSLSNAQSSTSANNPTSISDSTSNNTVLPLNTVASVSASSSKHAPLPQFGNFTKSLLLNRRKIKMGGPEGLGQSDGTRTPSIPPYAIHPRLQMVDSFLQAFAHDEALFEFGPSHRHRNLSNNTLTAGTVDVLSNAFPSPTARTLFHHYFNTASRILITMGNIGPNPLLAVCTPLKLLDTNSAASAAIRMSMLSVGVAHFTHETKDAVGKNELGRNWETQRKKLKEMGSKFKKAALSNITLAARAQNGPDQIDSILAACTLLCIRDVISADPTWRDNLEFALYLIGKQGGPQAMLQGTGYSFTRRYLLENLATHDVFASFITGKEPAVLGNYDTWWFDSVETSQTRWEWESVERSFGISRAMVDLVARIAVLDSQKRRLGVTLQGGIEEMWDIAQHFERESHCLLLELDIWGNSLNALPQHVRVTCGDYIYKYMAVVFILADILEQPISTPRIVKCIDHILELLSEASAMRMSVMLIWPLLIAGVFALPEKRDKVRGLFDAFQGDYCEDLEVARELMDEQWRGIDNGEGKQPWDKVMNKLGKYVLLI